MPYLMERYRTWFGVNLELLLYDLTSTCFEGMAEGNDKAARGHRRDHRGDCKQGCIGLVCTPDGLPLSFEVFAGNRIDVTTVKEIVAKMEDRFVACRSATRRAKERAMLERSMTRLTEELAKGDIGLRPVFHQKAERVEAHLLVCFPSLAMGRTLELWRAGKGLGASARRLVEAVGTIRSMDVSVPVKRGDREVTRGLRTAAMPDADVAQLLAHLGLRLPKGPRLVENEWEKTVA